MNNNTQQMPKGGIWIKATSTEAEEIFIQVGDTIRLYGKETVVEGFYGRYNEGLRRWETIILTTKRGDPFERSINAIEVDTQNTKSPYPPQTAADLTQSRAERDAYRKALGQIFILGSSSHSDGPHFTQAATIAMNAINKFNPPKQQDNGYEQKGS